MKKILLSVVVIVCFNTSVFSNIQLTAANLGNNQIAIGYNVTSGSNVPVGFGLNLSLTGGATFESVVSTSPLFPLFPSTIAIDSTGCITNWGTPVSPMFNPGSMGTLGSSGITIEMSSDMAYLEGSGPLDLNHDGLIDLFDYFVFVNNWLIDGFEVEGDFNQDGLVNMLDMALLADSQSIGQNLSQLLVLEIDLNGATNPMLCIAPESTYRGGVVADDGTIFTVDPFLIIVPEPCTLILISIGGMILRKRSK
ncbi:MAG: hypothetical protein ABFD79_15195 [Phycisphaerales bacterium]